LVPSHLEVCPSANVADIAETKWIKQLGSTNPLVGYNDLDGPPKNSKKFWACNRYSGPAPRVHTNKWAFAWSGGAKKLSSNDSFSKNVVKCSYIIQIERFLLLKVGFGTL
jgi:hypothetical protein